MRPIPLRILLCLLVVTCLGPRAWGQAQNLLASQRWQEHSFGLSLLPPANFKRLEPPADGALVTFIDPAPTTISVFVHQADEHLTFEALKQQAIFNITLGIGEALPTVDEEIRPAGRPGRLIYFGIRDSTGQPRMFGIAMVRIDPTTVVSLRFETSADEFEQGRAIFEAVLDSIELADPRDLDRIRTAWIKAGQRWHNGIKRDDLKQAMRGEQWLRVINREKQDVGYARIRHRLDTMMGIEGIHVAIASRIVVGADSYDTESFFFESNDGSVEVWSVRTAKRSLDPRQPQLPSNAPGGGPQGPVVVTETGIRSGGKITVKREAPGDIDNHEWPTPPNGYLSQVEIQLLPTLLPRNRQHEFAFYTYNSSDSSIGLRTVQVYPMESGGYVVRQRPAPDRGEQISTYDRSGHLVRRQMPNGLTMVPASAQEMRLIWDIR